MSQKVIIQPDENGLNPTVNIGDMATSNQLPVNVSYHESTTIQTHNAVSVGISSTSAESNYHDSIGYTDISATLLNDATTSNGLLIYWSNDGSTIHGVDQLLADASPGFSNARTANTKIKARYFKFAVRNLDGALAHTMSAWAYLLT